MFTQRHDLRRFLIQLLGRKTDVWTQEGQAALQLAIVNGLNKAVAHTKHLRNVPPVRPSRQSSPKNGRARVLMVVMRLRLKCRLDKPSASR
ncbi:hypothetical protein GT37_15885 [Pseudomonas putida]|nr:hypothetical protein GT37_15885 [Pseudomonas putida]